MYNVYVKRIFVIMHMNAGVSSEKEKVKESQSQRDTPARHPIGCRVGGVTVCALQPHFVEVYKCKNVENWCHEYTKKKAHINEFTPIVSEYDLNITMKLGFGP